jgi:hypothetical protein
VVVLVLVDFQNLVMLLVVVLVVVDRGTIRFQLEQVILQALLQYKDIAVELVHPILDLSPVVQVEVVLAVLVK